MEAYAGLQLRPLAWPPVRMEPRLWVLRLKGWGETGGGDRDGQ